MPFFYWKNANFAVLNNKTASFIGDVKVDRMYVYRSVPNKKTEVIQ